MVEKTPPEETPRTTGVLAAPEGVNAAAAVNYVVAVYTGDVPGAGTDGDVWLWFDGTMGRSGPPWRYLDNSDNNFERNQTDYFTLTLNDIGTPIACWVYFVHSGAGADWYLSTITINNRTFSYYNWLTQTGMVRLTTT